ERASFDWHLPNAIGPKPSDSSNCCSAPDPDSIHAWYINGQQPKAGQIFSNYHGFTLADLPPPIQGFAANKMLSILAACVGKVYPGQSLASLGPTDARYWHLLVEAKKLAYGDLI